jgi:hypothetical protein
MADPILDDLNTTTLYEIYPNVLEDNYFRNAPLLAYMRNSKAFVPYDGGVYSQVTFAYRGTVGAFFTQGASFNLTKPQLRASANFIPKLVYDNVTEWLPDITISNRGPLAVFSLVDTDLALAVNTINARIDIALYYHGQSASGTNITDDRTAAPNGLMEAYNDGVTMGWNGDIFPTYGGATRTATIYNSSWSSPPAYFVGNNSTGAGGQITYNILLERYLECRRGNEAPNLILSNKKAFGYMLEKLQPQQRFTGMETDPIWGVEGFKFMNAMYLVDDYAPSALSTASPPGTGVNDTNIGNYSTSAALAINGTPAAASNLPSTGTVNVGEVVTLINTNKLLFRVAADPLWQFGFTGFMRPVDSLDVSGQILAATTLECVAPWSGNWIYGIIG